MLPHKSVFCQEYHTHARICNISTRKRDSSLHNTLYIITSYHPYLLQLKRRADIAASLLLLNHPCHRLPSDQGHCSIHTSAHHLLPMSCLYNERGCTG